MVLVVSAAEAVSLRAVLTAGPGVARIDVATIFVRERPLAPQHKSD
jgi:hypothetical protein